ncbi:MAG TPA: ABC transporter permease [Thermomicrobiales bacterium]|jgi:peptide/nickel transport system permease protein|nr:ABC transporter permease [Thermomicrobiales bacterium]
MKAATSTRRTAGATVSGAPSDEPALVALGRKSATRTQWQRVVHEVVTNRLALAGAIILIAAATVAILAPLLATHDPRDQSLLNRLSPPSSEYRLGTDELGRDEFSRLVWGARNSLFIGFAGTAGGLLLGTVIGLAAGFFGGWLDTIIMRLIDVMYAFPGILLAILIVAIVGPSITNLIVVLAIWGTPTLSRIVRSSVLMLKSEEFIHAATALGATRTRIMARHLLPNCVGPIIVYATLGLADALLTTAGLGFLGLGVQAPAPEWGTMLSVGRNYLREAPHLMVFPGLLILLTVISLNLIGDALRDALDPRTR